MEEVAQLMAEGVTRLAAGEVIRLTAEKWLSLSTLYRTWWKTFTPRYHPIGGGGDNDWQQRSLRWLEYSLQQVVAHVWARKMPRVPEG